MTRTAERTHGFTESVIREMTRVTSDVGVAAVPGSSFYSRPELGNTKLRFAFPKMPKTLRAAGDRLLGWQHEERAAQPRATA